jgi:miniconductance mechanosensitive channel
MSIDSGIWGNVGIGLSIGALRTVSLRDGGCVIDGMVYEWLRTWGMSESSARLLTLVVESAAVALVAVAAHFFVRAIVARVVRRVVATFKAEWLQSVDRRRPISRLAHLVPAVVVYHATSIVLANYPTALHALRQLCLVYMTLATAWMVSGIIQVSEDIARQDHTTGRLPVRSFTQVAQIIVFIVTAIVVTSLVLDRSPAILLTGLGAAGAVLLLVFKDAIMGLVAGVQLTANRMVEIGDWIEMPKYGADGFVIDIALTTVKVQNWDMTITTVPSYALISDSFKNWRGMFESGGRRIKRAILVDMATVRFCTDEMIERYSQIEHVAGYLGAKREEIEAWNREHGVDPSVEVNGRRLTNVGTFRAYIEAYIRNHPMIHTGMTLLVRQLAPTPQGLPIEIYAFTRDNRWVAYEGIQADIFDHILAAAPAFDLRVFQQPTGSDMRSLGQAAAAARDGKG